DVVRDVVNRLRKLVAAVLVDKGLVEKEDDALRLVQPVISTGSAPSTTVERRSVKTVVVVGSSIPNIVSLRQLASAVGDAGCIVRIKSSVPTASDHKVLSGPALIRALDVVVDEFEGITGLAEDARLGDIARLTSVGTAATSKLEAIGTPEATETSAILMSFIWRKVQSWFSIALRQVNELERYFIGDVSGDHTHRNALGGRYMYRDQLLDDLYQGDLEMPASMPTERRELRERIATDSLALVNTVWFGNAAGPCKNPACCTPTARSWHRGPDGKTLCKMCFGIWRRLGIMWTPSLAACQHCFRDLQELKGVRLIYEDLSTSCASCVAFQRAKGEWPPAEWDRTCGAQGIVFYEGVWRCANDNAYFRSHGKEKAPAGAICAAPGSKTNETDYCPACNRIVSTHGYVPEGERCTFCGQRFADCSMGPTRKTIQRFLKTACASCYQRLVVKAGGTGLVNFDDAVAHARKLRGRQDARNAANRQPEEASAEGSSAEAGGPAANDQAGLASIENGEDKRMSKKRRLTQAEDADTIKQDGFEAPTRLVLQFLASRGTVSMKIKRPETVLKHLLQKGFSVDGVLMWAFDYGCEPYGTSFRPDPQRPPKTKAEHELHEANDYVHDPCSRDNIAMSDTYARFINEQDKQDRQDEQDEQDGEDEQDKQGGQDEEDELEDDELDDGL
ncbi:hypothetical protein JCM3770_006375, partial [Rhodotorula araucariae]